MPQISVCLLTYNRAPVLSRSIESILQQDYDDFELIINDDCSTDETATVCQHYARLDPRVKYYRNNRNLRYAGNQNAALERASGEFIAYVHDGDVYYPSMLRSWANSLQRFPSAGIVFNAIKVRPEHGVAATTYIHPYEPLVNGRELFSEMIWSASSPIFGIVMIRRRTLQDVGQFDTMLPVLADVDMWLRILLKYDAAYVSTPLYEIMPRENGHINRPKIVNWNIQAERDAIYFKNLARLYTGWQRTPAHLRRKMSFIRTSEHTYLAVRCLLAGRIAEFREGLKLLMAGYPFGSTSNLRNQLNDEGYGDLTGL